jgi:hypothetical protein
MGDRSLLELPDFADTTDIFDTGSTEHSSPPVSSLYDPPGESLGENEDSQSYSQALRLLARLGQPFSALSLVQQ